MLEDRSKGVLNTGLIQANSNASHARRASDRHSTSKAVFKETSLSARSIRTPRKPLAKNVLTEELPSFTTTDSSRNYVSPSLLITIANSSRLLVKTTKEICCNAINASQDTTSPLKPVSST